MKKIIDYTKTYNAIIGDYIKTKNGIVEVLDINNKKIFYKCTKCQYTDWKTKSNFIKGRGCPVCVNQKIIKGINDICTTNKQLAEKLWDINDGYKYSSGTNKKVHWKCDCCGQKTKLISINYIDKKQTVYCDICNDGISYPNKFARAILDQANIKYHTELTKPKWFNGSYKRYDFLLDDFKIFIEMDGGYGHGNNAKTRDNDILNDAIKDNEAIKNGYAIVRIDCNYNDITDRFKYIKNNFCNNKILQSIIDFNKVDFEKIRIKIEDSFVIKCCKLWNTTDYNLSEIASILKIHQNTVSNLLVLGNKAGLTDFNKNSSSHWKRSHGEKQTCKRYICLETGDIFNGMEEAARWCNCTHVRRICDCTNGRKKYAGFHPETKEKLTWGILTKDNKIKTKNTVPIWLCQQYEIIK